MIDIHNLIETYSNEYSLYGKPIEVNFREMLPDLNKSERYTHSIHPYPAKLLCHIPYFFLQTDDLCPKHGVVLDPFCGTGTVALETVLTGRWAYGADANPLARKITRVKLQYIPKRSLENTLSSIIKVVHNVTEITIDDDSLQMWYSDKVLLELLKLSHVISSIRVGKIRDFFEVCLSVTARKVSIADPRIAVPVRLNPERFKTSPTNYKTARQQLLDAKNADVVARFEQIARVNIERVQSLKYVRVQSEVISDDARRLSQKYHSRKMLPAESVDMILTSPPYAGAQKYIRASRLNLYWLGIRSTEQIHTLNDKNIGREDYHKKQIVRLSTGIPAADEILHKLYDEGKRERAFIVGNYLLEMQQALNESIRVLKTGGTMVLVIGNNTVCGQEFDTQDYLSSYLQKKGLKLKFKLIDSIKSYGLMTKRNKTASRISREWILVFKK